MPRLEIDYSKSVIYKIVCDDLSITDMYIGSTTNFTNRKRHHKEACIYEKDKHYRYKVYEFIRNNGGWENWSMIEIEKFSCKDKNELFARERHFYESLKPSLNMRFPQMNKSEYDKNYMILNKDKFTVNHMCDCGGSYKYKGDKLRHLRTLKHQNYELQKISSP